MIISIKILQLIILYYFCKKLILLKAKVKSFSLKSSKKKHKRFLRIKERKRAFRRSIQNLCKEEIHYRSLMTRYDKNYIVVTAPKIFSLKDDPEAFVLFIKKVENIKKAISSKSIMFNLHNVEVLDFSAVSLLISLGYNLKLNNINFNGLNPKSKYLRWLLNEYKFLEQIGIAPSYENIHFSFGKKSDKITIKGDSKVKSELGIKIADYVSEMLFQKTGYYNDGLQILFLELMANTTKWSDQSGEHNLWLLTMSFDKVSNQIEFQFIDYGIGVFESLKRSGNYASWYSQFYKVISNNNKIFESMLEGNSNIYKSSTGQYFRGKGIPSIKENFINKYYDNVEILTNDVYVNLSNDKYLNLKNNFNGTLIKWTINSENKFMNYNL